jgi:GntR family transcriptional regulator
MSGELAPGAQLLSTQHLLRQYAAANATIQRALAALKAEGFVYSRVGKGVYVRDEQPFVVPVAAYCTPTPTGHSYQLLAVTEAPPPAEVAEVLTTEELETLELPDDVPVIRQFRVISSDEHRPAEVSILIKGAHRYELQYHQNII